MVKPLTVYKASAGSGKTFTLATKYIKLLIENPMSYRNILAVTFTNKATEEMKMRILSQLYGIWKGLPDSDSYRQNILKATGLDSTTVSQRAGEALHLLLHNYHDFRVETIDTFFQSVLRNLARELDLTANLRVGLNDIQVEEQAVDSLIDSLTRNDRILQWIMRYIMDNISENRNWNIIGQVKTFGRNIFRDYYKEKGSKLREKTDDNHFFDHYIRQLRDIRDTALNHMQAIGDEFMHTLESENIPVEELLYGRNGVAGFFLKLQAGQFDEEIVGKRTADAVEDATKWCKKTHPRAEEIQMLAESTLIPLLRRAIQERDRQWMLYQSAHLTLRHLSQLRLLGSIEQKVRELNDASSRFLLSDTQQLLHELIKGSDSPFIFEKIGTQLKHVMIDEFQDTSSVQWQNFKVLLLECMSHAGSENLIVGDVKQSIYRWRSGDWRLMNAIEREFPNATDMLDIKPLETNYRSERNIINFNNAFFTEAARIECEKQREEYPDGAAQLQHAYDDVEQLVPEKRQHDGRVCVTLLTKEDYQEQVMETVGYTLQMLLSEGMQQRQIAILVRTNKQIPAIADYLSDRLPHLNIVSDEAFRLDASTANKVMVNALRLLVHPDDDLTKATLAKLYQNDVLGNITADYELFVKGQPLDPLLPESFIKCSNDLLQLPLYELAERLYHVFQLQRLIGQSGYVSMFYDQLNQFAQDNSTDIDDFLNEWEETISSKTIQSDATDGIRILTIHKSKGLEYDNVIIPFCDWRLEQPDILWCKPSASPFDALPLAPIDYSEKLMRGTIYEHDYLVEHLQNTVDNLNLLYVAFTRASRNLFVIGKRGTKTSRSALIESVLPAVSKKLTDSMLEGMDDESQPLIFSYGKLARHASAADSEVKRSDNAFLQPVTPQPADIESFETMPEFRQSNKSREFIEGDEEQEEQNYIKTGSVLHDIFSHIRTVDDIGDALQQLQSEGVLYDDEITAEKLTNLLRKRLEDKRVSDWFSGRWNVLNECSILTTDAEGKVVTRRPDRVITNGSETHVIDFKFGRPHQEYHEQVGEYIQLLQEMGMPQVRGWLWYVYSNRIEEVTLNEE